jgi:hypothetical protein
VPPAQLACISQRSGSGESGFVTSVMAGARGNNRGLSTRGGQCKGWALDNFRGSSDDDLSDTRLGDRALVGNCCLSPNFASVALAPRNGNSNGNALNLGIGLPPKDGNLSAMERIGGSALLCVREIQMG